VGEPVWRPGTQLTGREAVIWFEGSNLKHRQQQVALIRKRS
jgi:hypothetical protein